MRHRWPLSIALVLGLGLGSIPRADADRPAVYAVRSGDALSLIAERFDVSVEELREWNDIEGDRILIGQELRLVPTASNEEASPPASPETTSPTVESQTEETPTVESPTEERPAPRSDGPVYQIREGETLSEVAVRLQTDIPTLVRLNPGMNPDRIRAGQNIRIPEARAAIDYVVARGDSLHRIASRHEVSVRELLRWNPPVRRHGLLAGRTIRIYSDVPVSRSESIGLPYNGRLEHGVQLPPHPLYVIRERSRAYGTLETVRWITAAFDAVREAFPRGPRVRVHDLSDEDGGALRDHRSHQSGRDVDMAFFRRRCGQNECGFANTAPGQIDVRRQWKLFKHWLERDQVEAIFIDYSLQRPLYEHARREGATPRQLRTWFQYPRGQEHAFGIVRHFAHHQDHAHIRFACPDTDDECRAGWRFAAAH